MHESMARVLLVLILGFLGSPWLRGATYSYLHVEIFASSNAQVTEGLLGEDEDAFGAPQSADPTALFASIDRNFYHTLHGVEGYLPDSYTGPLLLCAAKDGSYASHVGMSILDEGVVGATSAEILVNSRERISYDLATDSFFYGTKLIDFPRDEEWQIAFVYGGVFTYYGPDHFEVLTASGVRNDVTIRTVPEPAAGGMILIAVAGLVALRRSRGLPA